MDITVSEISNIAKQLQETITEEEDLCFESVKGILCKYSPENRKEIVEWRHSGRNAIFVAVILNCQNLVKFMLEKCSVDTEIKCLYECSDDDPTDAPLLWAAVMKGNIEIAQILIDHGADINGFVETNSTAVRGACYNNDQHMVEYLVSAGADINIANNHGSTCLMNSVKSDKLVKFLIEKGADLNAKETGRGCLTALHYAIHCSELSSVKVLVESGSDLNIPDKIMKTPLRTAALFLETEIIEYLLSLPSISDQDKIEAYYLLAASSVDSGNYTDATNYWTKALEHLETLPPDKKRNVSDAQNKYHGVKEPASMSEWNNMNKDPETLLRLAVLVKGRILGNMHEEFAWSLDEYASHKLKNGQKRQAMDLYLTIFNTYLLQHGLLHEETVSVQVDYVTLLVDVVFGTKLSEKESEELYIESLCFFRSLVKEIESKTKLDDEEEKVFCKFLCIILYSLKALLALVDKLSKEDFKVHLMSLVRRLIAIDPRVEAGNSVFHLLVDKALFIHLKEIETSECSPFGDKEMLHFLVQNGLSINAKNDMGETMLHSYVRTLQPDVEIQNDLKYLLDLGAHLDAADNANETCLFRIRQRRIDIPEMKYLTLQCLASSVITTYGISYQDNIPTFLIPFVQLHGPKCD